MGRVLHHDSLLKKVIEGRMKGRKKPGRTKEMLLDWLMKRIQNGLFTDKADDRRQNLTAFINTGPVQWRKTYRIGKRRRSTNVSATALSISTSNTIYV